MRQETIVSRLASHVLLFRVSRPGNRPILAIKETPEAGVTNKRVHGGTRAQSFGGEVAFGWSRKRVSAEKKRVYMKKVARECEKINALTCPPSRLCSPRPKAMWKRVISRHFLPPASVSAMLR